MKILFLSVRPPWPPITGYTTRLSGLARHLAANHELYLLALNARAETCDQANPDGIFKRIDAVPTKERRVWALVRSVLGAAPYHVYFYEIASARSALQRIVRETNPDVIYTHFLYFADVLRSIPTQGIVLAVDQNNLDRDVWLQKVRHESTFPRRLYSLFNLWKTVRFEGHAYPLYDLVVACSCRDAASTARIPGAPTIAVVPNGVDLDNFGTIVPPSQRGSHEILFVGSDVPMNVQAVQWFGERVWPEIRRELPDVKFTVVGGVAAKHVECFRAEDRVEFLGWVPAVEPFLKRARLFVAPHLVGGGSKLKVLEAFAGGCPVVATPAGIVGLDRAEPGQHFFLAEEPTEFAQACKMLLSDGLRADQLAAMARQLVENSYSWKAAAAILEEHFQQILAQKLHKSRKSTR